VYGYLFENQLPENSYRFTIRKKVKQKI